MSNYPPESAGAAAPGPRSHPPLRRGVKALVASPSRVLLVEERHADGRTFWTLPGGGVEAGESPTGALRRELAEELRCAAVVGDPVSSFLYAHQSDGSVSAYTVFDCSLASAPRPVRREGILDARWVDPDRPPARTLLQVRRLLGAVAGDRR